jgi:hypothetical protein
MEIQTSAGIAKLKNSEQLLGILAAVELTGNTDLVTVPAKYYKQLKRRTIAEYLRDIGESELEIEWTSELKKFLYKITLVYNGKLIVVVFSDPSFVSGIASAITWFELPSNLIGEVTDLDGNPKEVRF